MLIMVSQPMALPVLQKPLQLLLRQVSQMRVAASLQMALLTSQALLQLRPQQVMFTGFEYLHDRAYT